VIWPWAKSKRGNTPGSALPDALAFTTSQQRLLILAVILALLLGFVLVRKFVTIIVLAGILAFIFHPLYVRLERRLKRPGTAAMFTFFIMLVVIIIPLAITIAITLGQIQHLINQLAHGTSGSLSLTDTSNNLLDAINRALNVVTNGAYQISADELRNFFANITSKLANSLLNLLSSSFSGIANLITQFILFLYVFTSMLTHTKELLMTFRALNPLGDEFTSLYLSRAGAMIKGTINGQFVIALCQGVASAAFLYIAGIHYFFFFALILTFLSVIPLGGGIIAIPIGIILLITGHIWQGLFVLLTHFFVTTNIDNVLRPMLIPRAVRINSALMMLAVFGGLGLFGFLGIVIGPTIMVLVLSTVQVYLPLARSSKGPLATTKIEEAA
jgi:predicted PurR-regulated permease PerM